MEILIVRETGLRCLSTLLIGRFTSKANYYSHDRSARYKRIATSVPIKTKRAHNNRRELHALNEDIEPNRGNLLGLREQLKLLGLRNDSTADRKNQTANQLSLISYTREQNTSKPGVFGFRLNLSDVNATDYKKGKHPVKSNTRYNRFFQARKTKQIQDPEQEFHEKMVAYKNSLPPFFKSTKYVLINKEGELLQEETEALRAQLSPYPENFQETEVPFSNNDEESLNYYEGRTEGDRIIQLVPKKFKENLTYKYRDKHTDERMKSVRELKKIRIPASEFKSDEDDHMEHMKKTGKLSLLSPQDILSKGQGKKVSMHSDIDSKYAPGDRSLHLKDLTTGYPYQKEPESDYEQDNISGYMSGDNEPFDIVNLQNEAFSKMFVETPLEIQGNFTSVYSFNEYINGRVLLTFIDV